MTQRLFALNLLCIATLALGCPQSEPDLPNTVAPQDTAIGGPLLLDAVGVKMLGGDEDTGVVGSDAAAMRDVAVFEDAAVSEDAQGEAPDVSETDSGVGTPDVPAPTVDVGTGDPDVGVEPMDVSEPVDVPVAAPDVPVVVDTGSVGGTEAAVAACEAVFDAGCGWLDKCAAEVPFGGQQLASYAQQCNDFLASPEAGLDAGCMDAAQGDNGDALGALSPEQAASCIEQYDCGLGGVTAFGSAFYPVFQAFSGGGDVAGAVPGVIDAVLGGCK